MDLIRRASRMVPGPSSFELLPTNEEKRRGGNNQARGVHPTIAFFRRPLRLRGNSAISVPLGVVVFFPVLVIFLIFVLFIRHPSAPSGPLMPPGAPPGIRKISEKYDKVFETGCREIDNTKPRANATLVILARNREIDGVVQSMKSMERHFNRWYNYPYTFLNNEEFDDNFKNTVRNYTNANVEFGYVGPDMWGFPAWADPKVAKEGIAKQGDAAVMYGGLESYHSMCRFYSGFFFNHPLLLKYEWYWRVEPEITYFCDITYDPFLEMEKNGKTYGFTIAVKELRETVPNLFRYASAYMRTNNLTSKGLWEMFVEPKPKGEKKIWEPKFPQEAMNIEPDTLPDIDLEAMEGEKYNMCHFWSNFEIARLSWFRSKEYQDFFEMMDRSGGFWMERWGDAPIHSLAAGALLGVEDIHYFRDIGYRHTTIQHCPANAPQRQLPHIPWLEKTTLDTKKRIEEDEYWSRHDEPKTNGVGCRCRCDTDIPDVEGKEGSCTPEWVDVAGGWSSP